MASQIQVGRRSCLIWLSWAAMSLSGVSGCASWEQVAHNIAHPWQASGDLVSRTSDRLEDGKTPPSTDSLNHQNVASSQFAQAAPPSTRAPKAAVLPANRPSSAPSKPLTAAPNDVELLPAPPVSQASASVATESPTIDSSVESAANTTWCRIRVCNIGGQSATQVSVTVSSPTKAMLFSKEGTTVSAPTHDKMEFAPVAQVGPNEEVILLVGVAASDERDNRLRVQIRDAQGGTNQELQSRWKIAIEAIE